MQHPIFSLYLHLDLKCKPTRSNISIVLGPTISWLVSLSQSPYVKKCKAVPLHAMDALGGRESIAPTHSLPRH
jgi:hypothetical protein